MDKKFGLEFVAADPWQAELLCQRIEADSNRRRRNRRRRFLSKPFVREIPPSGPNLREQASLTIECFNDYRLQLYPCEPLRRDLLKLRVEEKSYGYRLTSPRDEHGHGDLFSAFALALLIAHELAGKKPPRVVGPVWSTGSTVSTLSRDLDQQDRQRAQLEAHEDWIASLPETPNYRRIS